MGRLTWSRGALKKRIKNAPDERTPRRERSPLSSSEVDDVALTIAARRGARAPRPARRGRVGAGAAHTSAEDAIFYLWRRGC